MVGAMLAAAVIVIVLLTLALSQPAGLGVIAMLVGALLFSLPIPLLLYRLYTLLQSGYWVGREGLRIRWGLRLLDLPFDQIVDVARADEPDRPVVRHVHSTFSAAIRSASASATARFPSAE